jgi:hypothetical protein
MSSTGFDIDSLTLGEIARVEDISKMSIKRFSDPDAFVGRMTAALAYVVKRRSEPTFQFDQALNLTQREVNDLLDLDSDDDDEALDAEATADPTQAATTPQHSAATSAASPEPSDANETATSPSSWSPDSSI